MRSHLGRRREHGHHLTTPGLRRDCNGIGPGEVAGWWRCVPHDVAAPEVITMVPNAVVLNPRTDPDFVTFAESVLAEGPTTPESFEARLRERYPSAVVRPRELASEPLTLWYCYRDGTWTRPW